MIVDEAIALLRRQGSASLQQMLAGDQALGPDDLVTAEDHGLYGPGSVAWRVHGDASMLIGGLRALLIQTLHPLAMAGVAEHSDYREDPFGRLHRTGRFIGATTFGNTPTAEHAIEMVRRIHTRVSGTAPDGRPYSANDPMLLRWVHVTEVDSFLRAYLRYGGGRLTDAECDQYVAEMAEIGRRLGADKVPETMAELAASMEAFRLDLRYDRQAREAVRFLLTAPMPLAFRGSYTVITAGAIGLLPAWARSMMWLRLPPGFDPLAIRPGALALTRGLDWLMNAERADELSERILTN
jgi:uncharacterized protein (DUF2236 family)